LSSGSGANSRLGPFRHRQNADLCTRAHSTPAMILNSKRIMAPRGRNRGHGASRCVRVATPTGVSTAAHQRITLDGRGGSPFPARDLDSTLFESPSASDDFLAGNRNVAANSRPGGPLLNRQAFNVQIALPGRHTADDHVAPTIEQSLRRPVVAENATRPPVPPTSPLRGSTRATDRRRRCRSWAGRSRRRSEGADIGAVASVRTSSRAPRPTTVPARIKKNAPARYNNQPHGPVLARHWFSGAASPAPPPAKLSVNGRS